MKCWLKMSQTLRRPTTRRIASHALGLLCQRDRETSERQEVKLTYTRVRPLGHDAAPVCRSDETDPPNERGAPHAGS